MDIQSASVEMAQNRIQEEAGILVQAKMLQAIKDANADLALLMKSTQIITDPVKGNYLNELM